MPELRRCYRCERDILPRAFAIDRSKGSGRKSICKRCDRAKSRAYYAANSARVIARARRRQKGLQ